MRLKYTIRYRIDWKTHKGMTSVDKGLKEYLEEQGPFQNVDWLEEEIYEYYWSKDPDDLIPKEDHEYFDEMEELEILNMDELVEEFRYLIKEPSCCDKAPHGANFCPTCGKRLK